MRGTIVRLAVFVVFCLSFTMYLALTIGNTRLSQLNPLHPTSYRLAATFDDVTGLVVDDNVKVAGVIVGKVRGIKVVDGRALVSFQVRRSVKLPSDTSASIRWRNLIGQRYLYLYPGTASTVLRSGDHINQTRSVVDIGELFNKLGPIVAALDPGKVNQFLDAVTTALEGNTDKLRSALDDLAIITSDLASRDQAIQRLVTNLDTVAGTITSRDHEIRTVLDNLVTLAQTFSQNTDVLNGAVTDLGDLSTNLHDLLANNRVQVDRILGNLTTLAGVVQAKLPQLDQTLSALPRASAAIIRAGSIGQFLNQVIPCGQVGRNPNGTPQAQVPCTLPGMFPSQTPAGPGQAGSPNTGLGTGSSAPAPVPGLPAPVAGAGGVLQLLEGR
jgi:phospholipid/cholesterol/gamma-HCH transport system substrate-binding protein